MASSAGEHEEQRDLDLLRRGLPAEQIVELVARGEPPLDRWLVERLHDSGHEARHAYEKHGIFGLAWRATGIAAASALGLDPDTAEAFATSGPPPGVKLVRCIAYATADRFGLVAVGEAGQGVDVDWHGALWSDDWTWSEVVAAPVTMVRRRVLLFDCVDLAIESPERSLRFRFWARPEAPNNLAAAGLLVTRVEDARALTPR